MKGLMIPTRGEALWGVRRLLHRVLSLCVAVTLRVLNKCCSTFSSLHRRVTGMEGWAPY